MDKKETIQVGGSFLNLLKQLFIRNEEVGILFEDGGLTRANGRITGIFETAAAAWVEIDNFIGIRIDALYAVNGVFRPEAAEC